MAKQREPRARCWRADVPSPRCRACGCARPSRHRAWSCSRARRRCRRSPAGRRNRAAAALRCRASSIARSRRRTSFGPLMARLSPLYGLVERSILFRWSRPFRTLRSIAGRSRRCSGRSMPPSALRSSTADCGPAPSCRQAASWPSGSACRAPSSWRPTNSCWPRAMPPAASARALTWRRTCPTGPAAAQRSARPAAPRATARRGSPARSTSPCRATTARSISAAR